MRIGEINPFLRYVRASKFIPAPKPVRPLNYHFYYIISGEGRMCVDGEWRAFEKGTVIILPPGTQYYFAIEGKADIVSINFDYTQNCASRLEICPPVLLEEYDESRVVERVVFEDFASLNAPLFVKGNQYLEGKIMEIVDEYSEKKQLYRETASAHFRCVLMDLIRSTMWPERNSENVKAILDYVHRHFNEDIDNEALAAVVGYHSYYVNRLMKVFTGTTLRQYVINYRMEMAKQYLRETALSIAEISEKCGYPNISNFSEGFKKKTGVSPLTYRRNTQSRL